MSCVTCGHTMQKLNPAPVSGDYQLFWCPRCGTLSEDDGPEDPREPNVFVPKLVERCRVFEKNLSLDNCDEIPPCIDDWNRLGIAESIHPPDRRPT